MGVWRDQVLPRLTDLTLRGADVGRLRAATCAGLSGRVIEVGFGSGLNIPYYPVGVATVDAVEPAGVAWDLSRDRREAASVPVEHAGLDGQRLQADDGTYDAALTTFALCSIPDVATALSELHRVLRQGGVLHFLEHGLAPEPRVVAWQRRLEPWQRRFTGGCHLTRDVPALLTDAGFQVTTLSAAYVPGPAPSRPWGFVYRGRATA